MHSTSSSRQKYLDDLRKRNVVRSSGGLDGADENPSNGELKKKDTALGESCVLFLKSVTSVSRRVPECFHPFSCLGATISILQGIPSPFRVKAFKKILEIIELKR